MRKIIIYLKKYYNRLRLKVRNCIKLLTKQHPATHASIALLIICCILVFSCQRSYYRMKIAEKETEVLKAGNLADLASREYLLNLAFYAYYNITEVNIKDEKLRSLIVDYFGVTFKYSAKAITEALVTKGADTLTSSEFKLLVSKIVHDKYQNIIRDELEGFDPRFKKVMGKYVGDILRDSPTAISCLDLFPNNVYLSALLALLIDEANVKLLISSLKVSECYLLLQFGEGEIDSIYNDFYYNYSDE